MLYLLHFGFLDIAIKDLKVISLISRDQSFLIYQVANKPHFMMGDTEESDFSDSGSEEFEEINEKKLDDNENNSLEIEQYVTEEKLIEESEIQTKKGHPLIYVDKVINSSDIIRPLYQNVTPSFADEVPFLVDGDSLLVTVMLDPNWSNQLGGSSLHLVYLFERHLNVFVQRGGNFHIVFFQCWRNVWNENWNILFHRLILINHLSHNTKYQVHLFDHCFNKEFTHLIATIRPGFILTNLDMIENCSHFKNINSKYIIHMSNIFVLSFLQMDLPCIDTNYINVDISTLNAFYLENNPGVKSLCTVFGKVFRNYITELPQVKEINKLPIIPNAEQYNIRTWIALMAATIFYKETTDEEMLKKIFLTLTLMESLELKNRCCPKLTESLIELNYVMFEWQKAMFLAHTLLTNEQCDWTNVSDLWQGILFGHVCRLTSNGINNAEELGINISKRYEKYIANFNNNGYNIKAYPIKKSVLNVEWTTYVPTTINTNLSPPQEIKNSLVEQFCGSILYNIKWITPPDSLFKKKEYTEEHHYHSMRVLRDEHDHINATFILKSDDPWEKKKYQRQISKYARYMTLYGSSIEGRMLQSRAIIRTPNNVSEKKQKMGKKAQDIINQNKKKKDSEIFKREKENLDKIETLWKKADVKPDTVLHAIKLELTKIRPDSPLQLDYLSLKLKVLLKKIKNKSGTQTNREEEVKKNIFLTVRTALSLCQGQKMTSKQQELMSKCLAVIDCQEIAKRNDLPVVGKSNLDLDDTWIRYQLDKLGAELIRETNGVPDARVHGFIPDPWQRELFDIIDKKQSALIVAPTSSGKTYASYYCMEKVIKESEDGVVVYVSPTKALVNQVAATVYARFKDTPMPDGMSVYGIFTRDFRTHALNSQVLVTVPQCLELLLLSARRHNWVHRLRYVIFDEVHCIASDMGGLAWEHCLLLIRCPFLALSATVRNPEQMHAWLQLAEDYKLTRHATEQSVRKPDSYKVNLVIHSERHSDLTKYTFGNGELHHLHPYIHLESTVLNTHGGIPGHMLLSPAETLQLHDAMIFANAGSAKLKELSPDKYFSKLSENGFITRNLVRKYEQELSSLLIDWFTNENTDFETTINYLKPNNIDKIVGVGKRYIDENIVQFITNLRDRNMLPAIVFSYNRTLVDEMTKIMTKYFMNQKQTTDRREDKKNDKQEKLEKKLAHKTAAKQGIETRSRNARSRLNLLSGGAANSLQGVGMADSKELELIEHRLMQTVNANNVIINAMRNGICMHHAGFNNRIRSAVEMLFRKKVLNVVFATGTLAQGIHMPCKTTVIAGNSAYLNSLEYHQMSGRAGRRGYDTAGNVVFFGLNTRKQHTLLTAQLPDIKGNFPISVTFVLRLLLLVADVTDKGKESEEARKITVSRVMTLLDNCLIYMEEPKLKIQIQHFFSFSVQLLKMQEFINDFGEPLRWCGMATHLHYHEPGNLAFVYLLQNGIIRKICTEMDNETDILFTLVVILSHLFTKMPYNDALDKEFDNSKVILDPLPDFVYEALEIYNKQVHFVFHQYFNNVSMVSDEPDNILPVSSVRIVAENAAENTDTADNLKNNFLNLCTPKLVCSTFSTLSGNSDDDLYTPQNLISNIKQSMCTEVKTIPVIDLKRNLNGYALDFFRHGIVEAIRNDNGLKQGAEFALIKDFILLIKTIVVALEEMEVKDENDVVIGHFKKLSDKYNVLFCKAFDLSGF
ncbi:Mtr4 helicase [Carabus blaptoides fortunei]